MKILTLICLRVLIVSPVFVFGWLLHRWLPVIVRDIKRARSGRRVYRVRRPIRSTRNDAKRTAQRFASNYAGRELSWKAARKLLKRLERKLEVTT